MAYHDEDDYVPVEGLTIVTQTARATLVRTDEDDELWIPKSVIHEECYYAVGDTDVELNIKAWFATKEGIA